MPATQLHPMRLWTRDDEWATTTLRRPMDTSEAADRLYLREAFRSPPKDGHGPAAEAFSAEWFESIEEHRYRRHGTWIPRVLEFGRHSGDTVLALGEGLGTDWLQYARHDAHVLACSPALEQIDLWRRHFELRGLSAGFIHAPPHALSVETASIDVVCINGLLHELDRPEAVIEEMYRVLRPGGKVIAIAPAFYDAAYWHTRLFPWRRWFGRRPAGSEAGIRSATARTLKRDFARFDVHKISKRHLRRSQLPQLWRPFPLPVLERLIGQFLILKAFKPVSAALTESIAA